MTEKKSVYDLQQEIAHQLPVHASTFGTGVCGHKARGCRKCVKCLEKELADIVGDDLAREYVESVMRTQRALVACYEAEYNNETT